MTRIERISFHNLNLAYKVRFLFNEKMKTFIAVTFLVLSNVAHASIFIPEASGIAKVGEAIVIAGDEEPKALWIMEGNSTRKVKVSGKWDDMEGLAGVDGQKFFGITSHSLTKKGKQKPEREQLLLFGLAKNVSIEKSWSLREEILTYLEKKLGNELQMTKVRKGTPEEGGLNVEGLAYISGKLYLGLRSPVTNNGEAIVLEMSTPQTTPRISNAFRLELHGKGIRSLDVYKEGLLVLSGGSTDAEEKFDLHHFNLSSGQLIQLNIPRFEELIRPEGVVSEPDGSLLFVQDFEGEEAQDVVVRLQE